MPRTIVQVGGRTLLVREPSAELLRRDGRMGDVVSLARWRAAWPARRPAPDGRCGRTPATFFYDLGSPWTYLAAERVDRLFGDVRWRPVLAGELRRGWTTHAAGRRAFELRMPLVWPDPWPAEGRAAMRVAALAAERERGAAFALAAARLAFCGGYDLEDPEVLADAAAAGDLDVEEALAAAQDPCRDRWLEAGGAQLCGQGADRLPALRVGRALFCGERRLPEAAAAAVRHTARSSFGG